MQEALNKIILKMLVDAGFDQNEKRKLLESMKRVLGDATSIDIIYLNSIEDIDFDAKNRSVISKVNQGI